MALTLNVNGKAHAVDADPETPLLYVLRELRTDEPENPREPENPPREPPNERPPPPRRPPR